MVSTLALVLLYHFVTLRLIIFPRWKNFLMIQDFCRQRSFPQAKIFSLITEVFHKFKFVLDQGSFLPTKIFPWSRKFSTSKDFSLIKQIFMELMGYLCILVLNIWKFLEPFVLSGIIFQIRRPYNFSKILSFPTVHTLG